MHNYSKEFFAKISKPKISSRPTKVSLFYFLLGLVTSAAEEDWTEIDLLIFWTIQLKMVP